jgi:hypothetical protein
VRYAVTVEPEDRAAHPNASLVRATFEADDKDAALSSAEAAYRLMYPDVRKLRLQVVRVRSRTE